MDKRILIIFAAMAATIAIMVFAASYDARFTSLGAALGFAVLAADAGLSANRTLWKRAAAEPKDPEIAFRASQLNARLMAAVYGWGALAIFAVYGLTELWWFHSWQYGLAMGLIAALLLGFTHLLGDPESLFRSRRSLDASAVMAALQAAGAAAGLSFLFGAGKHLTLKSDWAANHVFIAGGLAIIAVSVLATVTHFRLRRAGA